MNGNKNQRGGNGLVREGIGCEGLQGNKERGSGTNRLVLLGTNIDLMSQVVGYCECRKERNKILPSSS